MRYYILVVTGFSLVTLSCDSGNISGPGKKTMVAHVEGMDYADAKPMIVPRADRLALAIRDINMWEMLWYPHV